MYVCMYERVFGQAGRRHIISVHRQTSDVGVCGGNAVSDYAAAARHVSCFCIVRLRASVSPRNAFVGFFGLCWVGGGGVTFCTFLKGVIGVSLFLRSCF